MSAQQERLWLVQRAVEKASDAKAAHVESVPVVEMFLGKVAWEGVVEVFDLTGHPKAKRAYGWAYQDGKETRFVAVLELPPVDSPNTAVRMAIVARAQK
jgi:hypothetical protein